MPQSKRIFLSSPHLGTSELNYIKEALDTNSMCPNGANVMGFEHDLQQYTAAGHVVALSTGTAAIHLALILLGVKPGDLVICQSFTFSATANPIAYQGATPVFVDSEPDTWNMDPGALEMAIRDCVRGALPGGPRLPKAIIPVHLYGMPANMKEIMAVADSYGIPVVEDAAEALGSSIHGQKCGTFGKFGILSFNGNKIITTSGGGALLSEDGELIAKARFLATQARDRAPHYQHSQIGYNYRMSNIVAGIGRGQLQVLDAHMALRRNNFERYKQYFESLRAKGYQVSLLKEPAGYQANRWLTTITINSEENKGITRETLRLAMEAANIETRPLWKPMHLQPVFAQYPFYSAFSSQLSAISYQQSALSSQISALSSQQSAVSTQQSVVSSKLSAISYQQSALSSQHSERRTQNEFNSLSEKLFDQGLCLPSGSNLTEEEWERIIQVLNEIFV